MTKEPYAQEVPLARTVDMRLNAAFGSPISIATAEGLCVGEPMSPVTGAVVCYAPTVEILRRAADEGRNLILSREHPFFVHGGLHHAYLAEGLVSVDPMLALGPGGTDRDLIPSAGLNGDFIVEAKRDLIFASDLIIYRQASAWDTFRPSAQSAALARALGIDLAPDQEQLRRRGVVGTLNEPVAVDALARVAAETLSCTPRIVGDTDLFVRTVAVLAGETDPVESLSALLSEPSIDAIVTGAGGILDEVDGGVSYFQDLRASGRRLSMITVGFGPSHEPGVREMAKWVAQVVPELDVQYWPSGDPTWVPGIELVKKH
ncbi:Nif3-like dinuclear metal center hexameric protein [Microbacterium sp. KSW4-11]|uniref:GTP cyclohydrolase 1 type 2 homolog n=1 Tax=Microbacterium gawkjiense TaxID=3067309 RepID=A0ABU3G999_9MICO|nr:Nif3-like dinuclear metal center hexameric protein [Microbacterium sp. KSW4-11]MDT3316383.1 Nif3-like dinuclear metal center hexameric protein [Microbacterium sp. KSW4-11]